jgi:preprotein translocase subunit YajC
MSRLIPLLSLLIVASTTFAGDGGPVVAPAPAVPGTTPAAPPASGMDPSFFIIIIGMILFMWLLVFRPQKKEEAKRKALIDALKTGHRVVTIGGVHGEVVAVGEATVDLNVAKGDKPVVMTFNRGAIATNTTLAAEAKPVAK